MPLTTSQKKPATQDLKESSDEKVLPSELRGWITPCVIRMVTFFCSFGEKIYGSHPDAQKRQYDYVWVRWRSWAVDGYVAFWFLFELWSYIVVWLLVPAGICGAGGFGPFISLVLTCVTTLHLIETISYSVRLSVFARTLSPDKAPAVASHPRLIVLGMVNYLELSLVCGCWYAWAPHLIGGERPIDWFDPLYMSMAAQLTIGFGDRFPKGILRPLVCLQGILAVVLLVIVVGRLIGQLSPIESIEERLQKQRELEAENWEL